MLVEVSVEEQTGPVSRGSRGCDGEMDGWVGG